MNYFKRFSIITLFVSFVICNSSFANLQQYIQVGAAGAKLPAALIANYYDCNDETKKALVFDSIYRALYILDAGLKIAQSRNEKPYNASLAEDVLDRGRLGSDVSLMEVGLSVYDLYCIFRNIRNFSALGSLDKGATTEKEQKKEDEMLAENDIELEQLLGIRRKPSKVKKVLYTLIKTGALTGDSFYSCRFGLARGDWNSVYRECNSWQGACSRILASCFDNKNGEVNSKIVAILSGIGLSLFSLSLPRYRQNQPELHVLYAQPVWGEPDPFWVPVLAPVHAAAALPNRTTDPELEKITEQIGLKQLFQRLGREADPHCGICCDEDFNDIVSVIDGCHHIFCRPCLEQAYDRVGHRCPMCMRDIWGVRDVRLDRGAE